MLNEQDCVDEAAQGNDAVRFDNAMFVLTHLVSLHHFQSLYDIWFNDTPQRTYRGWVEIFLMPTYCLISGALSSTQQTPERSRAIFSKLLACYLIPQALYCFTTRVVIADWVGLPPSALSPAYGLAPGPIASTQTLPSDPASYVAGWKATLDTGFVSAMLIPYHHLWYLLCLVPWRMAGVHHMQLRAPVLVAMVVGILSGFVSSGMIAFSFQPQPHRTVAHC